MTIPDSVTSLDSSAFYYCSAMTSVTTGNGVTSIGDIAFYNCFALTNVAIGNNVTNIESAAFGYCRSLASVTIPETDRKAMPFPVRYPASARVLLVAVP